MIVANHITTAPAKKYVPIFCLVAMSLLPASCFSPKRTSAEETHEVENPSIPPEINFEDIASRAGVNFKHESGSYGEFFLPEIMGSGAAFIDYDQDGWQDILLVGGGRWPESTIEDVQALYLFKNEMGIFRDVTQEMKLSDIRAYGFGLTVADFDNDRDDDFFFTTLNKNLLFKNNGDHFEEVSKSAGVSGENVWSMAAIFFDADLDGWLDLFVGNYLEWSMAHDRNMWCSIDGKTDNYCHPNLYKGVKGYFYRNNKDGTFSDETNLRGFDTHLNFAPIKTLGVAEIDYKNNGIPDLVIANDMQPDLLFVNDGKGYFKEVGISAGIAYNESGKPRSGMGIATADVDGSGFETIFVGNFSKQKISVFTETPPGLFQDKASSSGIGVPSFHTLTFGLALFDLDLDQDLDLFAANGHIFKDISKRFPNTSFRQLPHLFVNDSRGNFKDEAANSGADLTNSMVGRSVAYADIDLDGDLDLLLTENNGPVRLLRNNTKNTGNYLRVRLTGISTNRNAIGSRIEIYYQSGKKQSKRVKSSDGYLSQSEFPVTFGLGSCQKVDSIQVFWTSGIKQNFYEINVNQRLVIEEGNSMKVIN